MAELVTPTSTLARPRYRTIELHYCFTLFLAAALIPALRLAGLPLLFTWNEYFQIYWVEFFIQAISAGLILYFVDAPFAHSVMPFVNRYLRQKARLLFILPAILVLMLTLGRLNGILISVATILVLEFKDRVEESHASLLKLILDVVWPAAYLFVGLVLVFAYNDVIASLRYDGTADFVLSGWDAVLLGGHSIASLAHAFVGR